MWDGPAGKEDTKEILVVELSFDTTEVVIEFEKFRIESKSSPDFRDLSCSGGHYKGKEIRGIWRDHIN